MPAMLPLHPELKAALDEAKEAVGSAVQMGQDAYQAYKDWGAENRKMMNKVPGLGPLLDVTNEVAETPGLDVAFTLPEALARMSMEFANAGKRLSPEAAGRLKTLMQDAMTFFNPKITQHLEGPYPLHKYSYHRPMASSENPAANISFNLPEMYLDLEAATPGVKVPQKLLNEMIRHGEDAPVKNALGSVVHEFEHDVNERIPNMLWTSAFNIPKKQKIIGYDMKSLPFDLRSAAKKDYLRLNEISKDTGQYIPRFIAEDPDRWQYGLTAYDSGTRLGEEAASDFAAALKVLGPEYQDEIFTNLIPNKAVITDWMRLNDIKKAAGR